MNGLKKGMETKMSDVEAKMDGLKKCVEAKMNGVESKMDGLKKGRKLRWKEKWKI